MKVSYPRVAVIFIACATVAVVQSSLPVVAASRLRATNFFACGVNGPLLFAQFLLAQTLPPSIRPFYWIFHFLRLFIPANFMQFFPLCCLEAFAFWLYQKTCGYFPVVISLNHLFCCFSQLSFVTLSFFEATRRNLALAVCRSSRAGF